MSVTLGWKGTLEKGTTHPSLNASGLTKPVPECLRGQGSHCPHARLWHPCSFMLVSLPALRGFRSFSRLRSLGTGDADGMKAAGPCLLMLGCEFIQTGRDPGPGAGLQSEFCIRKCVVEVSSGAVTALVSSVLHIFPFVYHLNTLTTRSRGAERRSPVLPP